MVLRNYMEGVVFDMIKQVAGDVGCCTCERCRLDIAAYALNHLPPKYVVTNEVYAKLNYLDGQFGVDVMSTVIAGMQLVGKNPRH